MSTAKSVSDQLSEASPSSERNPDRILIVSDEVAEREVLLRKLSSLGYECKSSGSGQQALDLLSRLDLDLVLADISMPEMGGNAFLNRALEISPDIAVILIASSADIDAAVNSLKHGAYDYVTKPFSLDKMSLSVSRALEKRQLLLENLDYQRTLEEQVASRTRQLKETVRVLEHTYHSTLVALSKALDSRAAGSDSHSLRVTVYARLLSSRLGLEEHQIRSIEQGTLLHDIGKIGIPDALLHKPGPLDGEDWRLMRRHPEIGYRILSSVRFLKDAAQLVLHHHERYNGKGYPQGLKKNEICLGARIFAITDTLDDLTSDRPFQAAISFDEGRNEIKKLSGTQLDPDLVKVFWDIPASEWKKAREEIAAKTRRADYLRMDSQRRIR